MLVSKQGYTTIKNKRIRFLDYIKCKLGICPHCGRGLVSWRNLRRCFPLIGENFGCPSCGFRNFEHD